MSDLPIAKPYYSMARLTDQGDLFFRITVTLAPEKQMGIDILFARHQTPENCLLSLTKALSELTLKLSN